MKRAKPRDNNKKAEETNAFFRTLKILMTSSIAIKMNRKRKNPQEPQAA